MADDLLPFADATVASQISLIPTLTPALTIQSKQTQRSQINPVPKADIHHHIQPQPHHLLGLLPLTNNSSNRTLIAPLSTTSPSLLVTLSHGCKLLSFSTGITTSVHPLTENPAVIELTVQATLSELACRRMKSGCGVADVHTALARQSERAVGMRREVIGAMFVAGGEF
ncbi:hypothetical protein MMC21_003582 [Puttea exsequens]|nr:hypothetical protein [Puttea exsequens]